MKPDQKLILLLLSITLLIGCSSKKEPPKWPQVSAETRPWTRWWWHGSAVSKEGITSELESFKQAGLGGVEITPIFGVRGEEANFKDYLSPEWVDMLTHTLKEAERLGLGVDMATGTGWPFGGPWIGEENAPKNIAYKNWTLKGGEQLSEPVAYTQEPLLRTIRSNISIEKLAYPVSANANLQELAIDQVKYSKTLPLITLMAYSKDGDAVDLTENVKDGKLEWTAPEGQWELYGLFQGWHGKMVERAAPGGEGNVIDHFSKEALQVYLSRFDSALQNRDLSGLRAFFNDSYEVDDARGQADWTPGFFDAFRQINEYDLRHYLPALFGKADDDLNRRVLTDYRTTIEKLILENFTKEWKNWAQQKNAIIRNQAHGSPANILDLYATVDIPETEGTEMLKIKFASSAAHVMGKRLTSAESATWLNDHFLSSLADVRQNLERYLLGGVNHIFYHGTAYSPDDATWPGWLFYAAIHANDRNTWWDDFPALNEYISGIQSFMQNSQPDNDLLVYFPVYDRYAEPGHGLLEHFDIRGNFYRSEVKKIGDTLLANGYSFDFISDRQIANLDAADGKLTSGGNTYQAILIPATAFIPPETMENLAKLAQQGIRVLFHRHLPRDVPGLANLGERRQRLEQVKPTLTSKAEVSASLVELLDAAGIFPEKLVDMGLQYNRKKYRDGHCYFIVNWTDSAVDGYIPLTKGGKHATVFDPMLKKSGRARVKDEAVYLQLQPGESCLVITSDAPTGGELYPYYRTEAQIALTNPWQVRFVKGGPELPASATVSELTSWTEFAGDAGKAFSGTAVYTTTFDRPAGDAVAFRLNLGAVKNSAKVYLNGELMGTLIGPSYSVVIPAEKLKDTNELRIAVSNLMANRIIDMDKRRIEYRKFYNVNFPAHERENSRDGLFHADHWEPLSSGLLGPVTLERLREMEF